MGNDELLRNPASWPRFRAGDDLSGHEHDRLFVQDHSGKYRDVAAGIPGLERGSVSRGIAVADVYGDGRLSVAIARQWMDSVFLRNVYRGGSSLVLDLRLPGAVAGSRPAIGAAVTVTLPDKRRLVAQVDGGNGHSGKRAPEVHFGLGNLVAKIDLDVEICWRDARGIRRVSQKLSSGRYRIDLSGGALVLECAGQERRS